MSNSLRKCLIQIPDTEIEDYIVEIIIPSRSRMKSHEEEMGSRKTDYAIPKKKSVSERGILKNFYSFFHINSTTISYTLEIEMGLSMGLSVANCKIEFISKEEVKNFHMANIESKAEKRPSFQLNVNNGKQYYDEYTVWHGKYNPTELEWDDSVNTIKLSLKIRKVTGYKVIELSPLNIQDIQEEVDKEWNTFPEFFLSKNNSDIIIICDGTEFPSHRFLLSSRSSVFHQMLHSESEMKEAKEGKIEIMDIKSEIFKEFLRFLYCRQVENQDKIASDLIIVADKYDVQMLKKMCEKSLVEQVTPENTLEMYCLAEPLRAVALIEKAFNTMKTNKSKVFQDSKDVSEFSQRYPEVMLQLLQI